MSCLLSSSIFMRAVVALTLSINRPVGVLACSGISYWFLVLFYLFLTFCESSTLFLYFHKDQSIVWFESELNFNIIIFKWIMICALLFYGLLLAIKCLGHTLTIVIGWYHVTFSFMVIAARSVLQRNWHNSGLFKLWALFSNIKFHWLAFHDSLVLLEWRNLTPAYSLGFFWFEFEWWWCR